MSNPKESKVIISSRKAAKATFLARQLSAICGRSFNLERNEARNYWQVVPARRDLPEKVLEAYQEIAAGLATLWEHDSVIMWKKIELAEAMNR